MQERREAAFPRASGTRTEAPRSQTEIWRGVHNTRTLASVASRTALLGANAHFYKNLRQLSGHLFIATATPSRDSSWFMSQLFARMVALFCRRGLFFWFRGQRQRQTIGLGGGTLTIPAT